MFKAIAKLTGLGKGSKAVIKANSGSVCYDEEHRVVLPHPENTQLVSSIISSPPQASLEPIPSVVASVLIKCMSHLNSGSLSDKYLYDQNNEAAVELLVMAIKTAAVVSLHQYAPGVITSAILRVLRNHEPLVPYADYDEFISSPLSGANLLIINL